VTETEGGGLGPDTGATTPGTGDAREKEAGGASPRGSAPRSQGAGPGTSGVGPVIPARPVPEVRQSHIGGLAVRECHPPEGIERRGTALFVHGYPTSSYLWRSVLPVAAGAGWHAVAPDLAGFGDSEVDPPSTWEHQVEHLEGLRSALEVERVALVVHDWGGLIGLRWACDHPDAVSALVITDTGFFPDGRWHGLAQTLRTEGEGEQLVDGLDRPGFAELVRGQSASVPDEALDEYFKVFADEDRRRAQLELYRSGDFEKLDRYEGCLGRLGVPTLILWGAHDPFAPVAGGERFNREIPGSRLVVFDEAGHFLQEDEPVRLAAEIGGFLGGLSLPRTGDPHA
jgi:haloalkane dehalogenase